MQVEPTRNGFQIDAGALAPLLGVPAPDVQRLMREGRITSLCEEGRGADQGRHRITFRHGATRVRLTVNDAGEVLLRTRTTVAPRSASSRPSAGSTEETQSVSRPGVTPGAVPADLVRHVEQRFHSRLRQRFDELVKLADMVEDLHAADEGAPDGIHRLLGRMEWCIEAHMQTVEGIVIPAICRGAAEDLGPWMEGLRDDHDRLRKDCARLRDMTGGFAPPEAACTSWVTLYARLASLVDDVEEHMRLEAEALRACQDPGFCAEV